MSLKNSMTPWFTPQRRQSLQAVAATLAPLFILFGVGTEGQWEQILIIVGAVLQFLSNTSNLFYLATGGWSKIWDVLRGAIYALAATAAPAVVALGLWDESFAQLSITALSLTLAVLGNVVSIFVSSKQEHQVEHTGDPAALRAMG